MNPSTHFVSGIILAGILFFIFPDFIGISGFIIIFLSSFLIDIDHYISHSYSKKTLSLSKAYNWHVDISKRVKNWPKSKIKSYNYGWHFLHGIEILIVLLILGLFTSKYVLFIFFGFFLHNILDLFHEITHYKILDKFSTFYYLSKCKKY